MILDNECDWKLEWASLQKEAEVFNVIELELMGHPLSLLQVGAAISMTYITSKPIVFVGTGQTYCDLRSLNAKAVVAALMKA